MKIAYLAKHANHYVMDNLNLNKFIKFYIIFLNGIEKYEFNLFRYIYI